MAITYDVPFFGNTADNTHCFQAGLKMIIKYFQPDRNFSWEELDKITAKVEGLWTWPMAGVIWLTQNGYSVYGVEPFDYQRFAEEGGDYLIERYGEEIGNKQIKMSDIEQERRLSWDYIKKVKLNKHIPNISEIRQCLDNGYLVLCNVNSRSLNDTSGYSGHFVVVIGYDNDTLILHNPGLPPQQHQKVTSERFNTAWAFAGENTKGFLAIKR